ncbi:MAG: hypothetical protein ABIV13_03155 [Fimbriimonadales bacterium]
MRLIGSLSALLVAAAALAQNENPYASIEMALAQTQGQANITLNVGGWHQTPEGTQRFRLQLFAKDGKIYAEQFVDNIKRLIIVADGTKVWRYDPVVNEYTFMSQPEDFVRTVSLITGWSRKHLQRPLRALAGSVRWFTLPQFETGRSHVRVYQTKPLPNNDWRGTDATFLFDDRNRVERISIEDRLDMPTGFERTWSDAIFAYPDTLNVAFEFTPPRGSKPAADLPVRIAEGAGGGRGGGN